MTAFRIVEWLKLVIVTIAALALIALGQWQEERWEEADEEEL